MNGHRAPDYRITIAGQTISPELRARLSHLTLHDRRGMQADQLDMTLTDDDGLLDIPRTGVELTLAIGWQGETLVDRGTYIVDEVEHSGAPDQLNIRASSADLRQGLPGKYCCSWSDTTLGEVVSQVAARHQLTPSISESLAGIYIDHIDLTDESDLHFLTRLGEQYDGIVTVKAGHLLFITQGQARTASGEEIPPITITRRDGDQHRYLMAERDAFTGVTAMWHSKEDATRKTVTVGSADNPQQLRHTYANAQVAQEAARSEWQRLKRGHATFSLTLATGDPELTPETPVRLHGWKAAIDATAWIITDVRHELNDTAYTCAVEMETSN